jgi:hypothetical protein
MISVVAGKFSISSRAASGSMCKRVAISSSKGNRQTRPAMALAETNENAVAAKSKQKARAVAT